MRKKLLLLAVSLLGMASAQAQTLSVENNKFEALKGTEATLAINVGSATNVRDLQFDIVIPAGVTLGTPAPAANTYKLAASDPTAVEGGNKYTVILYSETAAKGATTINFPLTIPADFAGELWANLTSSTADGKWTNDAAAEAAATSTAYTFQIGRLGDANKDKSLSVSDAIAILDIMAGNYPDNIAADVNGDNTLSVSDAIGVLDLMAQ